MADIVSVISHGATGLHASASGMYALLFFVDLAIRATLLLTATFALVSLMRRASAALRHMIWAAAMMALLTLPVFVKVLPAWRILPQWATAGEGTAATPAVTDDLPANVMPANGGVVDGPSPVQPAPLTPVVPYAPSKPPELPGSSRDSAIAAPAPAIVLDWALIIWGGWFVGFVIAAIPLIVAPLSLRRLRRGSSPVTSAEWLALLDRLRAALRIPFAVRLYRSERYSVPMSFGILRPSVLLGADADFWPAERRRMVLLHELAHVRRRDCLVLALVRLARAAYWFVPPAWFATARVQVECERACDDLVLLAGTKSSEYASTLMAYAKSGQGRVPSVALAMARTSTLEGRLLAILDSARNRRRVTVGGIMTVVSVLIGCAVPLAMMQANGGGPAITPGGQNAPDASSYDTYVGYRTDAQFVRTALLISEIQWDGGVKTREIASKQLGRSDTQELLNVRGGKLYFQGVQSGLIMDPLANTVNQAIDGDSLMEVSRRLNSTMDRGANKLWWEQQEEKDHEGKPADFTYRLILMSAEKGASTLWDHVSYSAPLDNLWGRKPTTVWLDDRHVLSFHAAQPPKPPLTPGPQSVVVIDAETRQVTELGEIPWGYVDILPPHGSGDVAVITNAGIDERDAVGNTRWAGKVFAISEADVLSGKGKLAERPVKWGAFTLSGRVMPEERHRGAVVLQTLKCGDLTLLDSKDRNENFRVQISPDGRKVVWQTKAPNEEKLLYFDSDEKKMREIAKGPHVELGLWAVRQELAGEPHVPATRRSAGIITPASVVALNNDAFVALQSKYPGGATGVVVGIQGAGGLEVHSVSSPWAFRMGGVEGVEGGKLYFSGQPEMFDLRTGEFRQISMGDLGHQRRAQMRNDAVLGNKWAAWSQRGPVQDPASFRLTLHDLDTREEFTLIDGMEYQERPPIAWLDDRHLLTIHQVKSTVGDAENELIVVDIMTKKIIPVGRIPIGITTIMPPHGSGDAVVRRWDAKRSAQNLQPELYAVDARAAVAGTGKAGIRPMHLGAFTFEETLTPEGKLAGTRLAFGDTALSTKLVFEGLSISPDGNHVMWTETEHPASTYVYKNVLFYFDGSVKKISRIGEEISLPAWTSRSAIEGGIPITAAAWGKVNTEWEMSLFFHKDSAGHIVQAGGANPPADPRIVTARDTRGDMTLALDEGTMGGAVSMLVDKLGLRVCFEELALKQDKEVVTLDQEFSRLSRLSAAGRLTWMQQQRLKAATDMRARGMPETASFDSAVPRYSGTIRGKTAEQILDALTRETSYGWTKFDGTYVIHPQAWSVVYSQVHDLKTAGMTVREAVQKILDQVPEGADKISMMSLTAMPVAPGGDPEPWLSEKVPALDLSNLSMMESLCRVTQSGKDDAVWYIGGFTGGRALSLGARATAVIRVGHKGARQDRLWSRILR